jgi:hypothetical protein
MLPDVGKLTASGYQEQGNDKKLSEMNEDERGDYYEAHKDDETLFSKTPAPIRVRSSSTMFSLRIPASELTRIAEAAKARGITASELIRRATLAAIEDEDESQRAVAIGTAKAKARELAEALSKL